MKLFDISTDSTCDFYKSEIEENHLFFLPLKFTTLSAVTTFVLAISSPLVTMIIRNNHHQ